MAKKELVYEAKARRGLEQGANALADAVRVTLGPRGRNVILEKKFGSPSVVSDGVTIAKEIELKKPVENLGARLIRQAATKTNDVAGDGTTTATVLAQALIREGLKSVAAGAAPLAVKRGIDRGVQALAEAISRRSTPVTTETERAQVATISAGDAEIGQLVAQAFDKVGAEGVITVEEAKTATTTVEFVDGLQFDKGYLSPYMVTNAESMIAELEEPFLLLYEKKISSVQDLVPLLTKVASSGRPLVIVAESIEGEALALLVVNKVRGTLLTCAAKAPGFGDRRKAMMEDMAILTGGTFLTEDLGVKLENVTLDMLGQARRVVVTKDDTTLIGGAGSAEAVKGRMEQIRQQIEKTESNYDREKLEERLAKLAGGVAVIKVGAATETEMKERKARIEDALAATRAAIQEGVVPGGGVTLLNLQAVLDTVEAAGDEAIGLNILRRALEEPTRRIVENAGFDGSVVIGKIRDLEESYGLDAVSGQYVHMAEAGIVDPAKVVRCALENAGSIAGMILSTEAVVAEIPEPPPPPPPGGHGPHHHPGMM